MLNAQNPTEITEVETESSTPQAGMPGEFPPSGATYEEEQARSSVLEKPGVAGNDEQSSDGLLQTPDEDRARRSRGSRWPTREQLLAWLPFWAVILLGTLLRFWDLGAKPLHHDESLHAYFALQQVLYNTFRQWSSCASGANPNCYQYNRSEE